MRQLDLSYVNNHAPYSVTMRTEQVYYFKTDFGTLCTITFMDDYSIWETGDGDKSSEADCLFAGSIHIVGETHI